MLLEALEAKDFRNLEGKIQFGTGLNILAGENGQGKTNWLESIGVQTPEQTLTLRQGSCRQPRYLSLSLETGGFASPPHGGFAHSNYQVIRHKRRKTTGP